MILAAAQRKITDELWHRQSKEWEQELESVRRETAVHEKASHDYTVTGSKIIELAKYAHSLLYSAEPALFGRIRRKRLVC